MTKMTLILTVIAVVIGTFIGLYAMDIFGKNTANLRGLQAQVVSQTAQIAGLQNKLTVAEKEAMAQQMRIPAQVELTSRLEVSNQIIEQLRSQLAASEEATIATHEILTKTRLDFHEQIADLSRLRDEAVAKIERMSIQLNEAERSLNNLKEMSPGISYLSTLEEWITDLKKVWNN